MFTYCGRYGGQRWPDLEQYPKAELLSRMEAVERLIQGENKANKVD